MPPKRKLRSSAIPPNAASAAAYTDSSGTLANKRSKLSKPLASAKSTPDVDQSRATAVTKGRGALKKQTKLQNGKDGGGDDQAQANGSSDDTLTFDHSRAEERAGIVDRRFYPAEMSNERCAMYNSNEIPRPIELLNKTLAATHGAREKLAKANGGDAVIHWFKRDLRVRDNTALSRAAAAAKEKSVGIVGLWVVSPQDWEAHLVAPVKCDFERRSVEVLKGELAELGIPLVCEVVEKRGGVVSRVLEVAARLGAKDVFCNLEYEPDELRREDNLVKLGVEKGVNVQVFHDDCVVQPGSLKTGGGKQYAVYSPFFRS